VVVAIDVVGAHIEIVEGAGGPKARIAGSRIRVQDVAIWYEKMRMTADEIVANYPTINHAEVFAALSYYWDHREEIEAEIEAERMYVEAFMEQEPGRLPAIREQRRQAAGRAG
jgi:uncharacterized protein (DUF433 family)